MSNVRRLKKPASKPWTAAEDALLGRMSDRKVSERLEREPTEVYLRRRELGIPAWLRVGAGLRRPWSEEEDALLGTMSDAAVAQQLDCRRQEVIARRRRLGIATWRRGGRGLNGDQAQFQNLTYGS